MFDIRAFGRRDNVTVLLKSVHAICQFLDKGSFSKMTRFSLENE